MFKFENKDFYGSGRTFIPIEMNVHVYFTIVCSENPAQLIDINLALSLEGLLYQYIFTITSMGLKVLRDP